MQSNPHIPTRILRLPEVISRTGYRKTVIYEKMKNNSFPKQIKLGRAVGWVEQEISCWIDARIEASRTSSNST